MIEGFLWCSRIRLRDIVQHQYKTPHCILFRDEHYMNYISIESHCNSGTILWISYKVLNFGAGDQP